MPIDRECIVPGTCVILLFLSNGHVAAQRFIVHIGLYRSTLTLFNACACTICVCELMQLLTKSRWCLACVWFCLRNLNTGCIYMIRLFPLQEYPWCVLHEEKEKLSKERDHNRAYFCTKQLSYLSPTTLKPCCLHYWTQNTCLLCFKPFLIVISC